MSFRRRNHIVKYDVVIKLKVMSFRRRIHIVNYDVRGERAAGSFVMTSTCRRCALQLTQRVINAGDRWSFPSLTVAEVLCNLSTLYSFHSHFHAFCCHRWWVSFFPNFTLFFIAPSSVTRANCQTNWTSLVSSHLAACEGERERASHISALIDLAIGCHSCIACLANIIGWKCSVTMLKFSYASTNFSNTKNISFWANGTLN